MCAVFLTKNQISHSVSVANIASLAVAMETCVPSILAKQAIFLQNILRESCSKSNLKQLFHGIFCKNIARLVVAMETCSLDISQTSEILTEHTVRFVQRLPKLEECF